MRLYLARHGQACAKEENPERPLTDEGRRQAEKVAAFLKPLHLRVAEIRHSGKLRARQTAEILAEVVHAERGVKEAPGLAPNDKVKPVAKELAGLSGDISCSAGADVIIVGHLPHLARLACVLLGCPKSAEAVSFAEVSTVCLESSESGRWALLWAVSPGILAE